MSPELVRIGPGPSRLFQIHLLKSEVGSGLQSSIGDDVFRNDWLQHHYDLREAVPFSQNPKGELEQLENGQVIVGNR